ncbi:PaaI family thioesterase [Frankia sp. AgB32]|uniref:PaaI family thioesterase n=1 Tax=Frankia sp. AgB32 TaxID=631119 RepID=UPI00200C5EAF|nr:PaaI family thioesterase [Frankia sp. AgB32]MCK9895765.1 PaaI family thioesterase [Frankia sp. AgB32]
MHSHSAEPQPAEQTPEGADGEYLPVPWSVLADYRCFGCSPHNPNGLRLRFAARPDGEIDTRFRLGRGFESYPGIVHGGLIGVICDETMGNLIVLRTGLTALTTGMRMRYVTSMRIDADYQCVARLLTTEADAGSTPVGAGGLVRAESEILDSAGGLVASASATYRPISMASARERLDLRSDEFDQIEAALAATQVAGPAPVAGGPN